MILPLHVKVLPLLNDLWRRLNTLNSGLGAVALRRKDPRDMYYALMGVTSGFNADDINFFLERYRQGVPAWAYSQSLPRLKQLYDEIETRAESMQWVAAPATLEKIKSKLDKRDVRHRVKEKPPAL